MQIQARQPGQGPMAHSRSQEVLYDALGMITATAIRGKNDEGDTLSDPTTSLSYGLSEWKNNHHPVYVYVAARTIHQSSNCPWLESYTYSNGLGQEIQTKVQAEDGDAWHLSGGQKEQIYTDDRWVASGRTLMNNKGLVVKQYEPWFSTTNEYEGEDELTLYGPKITMHYDPAGRFIRTDFPDGTFSKVVFNAWQQENWDRNDTVLESDWYVAMEAGTDEEQRAADLTSEHAETPQLIDYDTLGRPFRTTDDNGTSVFTTRKTLDIGGNVIFVTDAKERQMTENIYDMTALLLFTANIDSGKRWMICNLLGKPIKLWDNRNNEITSGYDVVERPTTTSLKSGKDDALVLKTEEIVYGTDDENNLVGKPEYIYDQSGITHNQAFDFKGNLLEVDKRLTEVYDEIIDWNSSPSVQNETFTSSFEYDAMNRMTQQVKPDGTAEIYTYNKAGLPETISAHIRGSNSTKNFITNINYNEKGQRTDVYFGNQSKTRYDYDANTFRLIRLLTTRNSGADILQDLNYTYDPQGNIVQMTDHAQQIQYFHNSVIAPEGLYEYDPLYRLIRAEGRELNGLGMASDADFVNSIHLQPGEPPISPASPPILQHYTQVYSYDELGNLLTMSSQNRWRREYFYTPDGSNNYLVKHTENGNDEYAYDAHGNMTSMPHLSLMHWDYRDWLVKSVKAGITTWYTYDFNGNRVRKITEKTSGITEERIYLSGYEVYRTKITGALKLERQTVHIGDDKKRIALVDTKTVENESSIQNPLSSIRYQFDNHLGSACLELDEEASIISYEEYHPFGTTSYRSGRSEVEVSLKRYKYVSKERDEETGLYYYGARYYASWIARFVSVDQLQHKYPHYTPYQYAGNKPISYIDLDGLEEAKNYFSIYTLRQLDKNAVNINDTPRIFTSRDKYFDDSQKLGRQELISKEIIFENTEKTQNTIKQMRNDAEKNAGKGLPEPTALIIYNNKDNTVHLMRYSIKDDISSQGESRTKYNEHSNNEITDNVTVWLTPDESTIFNPKSNENYENLIILGQLHTNEPYLTSKDVSNSTSKRDQGAAITSGLPIYEADVTSGQINKVDPNPEIGKTQDINIKNLLRNALFTPRQNPIKE
jgi:RHS repeat-associated protein